MSVMGTMLKFVRRAAGTVFGKVNPTWAQIEYFNPEWKHRIQVMSQYVGKTDSVLDLGCGQMWLKEFLSSSNSYTGVDYQQRDSETIVCNFNNHEFPDVKADVFFISGCLEYVIDPGAFICRIAAGCKRCIISYCCLEEFPDIAKRREHAWVNDLSKDQLIELFARNGMDLAFEDKTVTNNCILIFDIKEEAVRTLPGLKEVAVAHHL